MADKTTKPSGLKLTRKNTKYTCEWKIGDSDYGDGQQFKNNSTQKKAIDIGKTATSRSFTINNNSYYPVTSTKLTKINYSVRGNRKKYRKSGKNISPGWSDWATKEVTLNPPRRPSMSVEVLAVDKSSFSWSVSVNDDDWFPYTNYEMQTVLVEDCNTNKGSEVNWKGVSSTINARTGGTYDTAEQAEHIFSKPYYSCTRWVRVRSRGVAGASDWTYGRHVYAIPPKPTAVAGTLTANGENNYTCAVSWHVANTYAHPIDAVKVQYVIAQPTVTTTVVDGIKTSTISFTGSASDWSDAAELTDVWNAGKYVFDIGQNLGTDQVIFVRVGTVHDSNESYSDPVLVENGIWPLTKPTLENISPIDPTTLRTSVGIVNNTGIVNSFTAIYYRMNSDPNNPIIVGIALDDEPSITIKVPQIDETGYSFSAQSFVADYSPAARPEDATYAIINKKMQSDETNWQGGSVPLPPSNVIVSQLSGTTVQVKWDWTWTEATEAELSWSDHEDAWESTDEPSTYIIGNTHAGQWNIAGLDVGTWYIRIRLIKSTNETSIYGSYSDIKTIKISSAPSVPYLTIPETVIQEDGEVNCYWAYTSTDGSGQQQADICEATYDQNGNITYGDIIASTTTEQHIVLKASDYGWLSGETHYLCVRVTSVSGEKSVNWSTPQPISIATKLTVSIEAHSLVPVQVPIEDDDPRTVLSLTALPFIAEIDCGGSDVSIIAVIERAEDYTLERPDGKKQNGFKGETIVIKKQTGAEQINIGQEDLTGYLDDGAAYNFVVYATDSYKQVAEARIDSFEVHWAHQAIMPEATIEVDTDRQAVFITPIAPTGSAEGDVCDIYRLSADRPILIIQNAEFGTKYVDPYPTIGQFGGHRVVFKTSNGDYITDDNHFAWIDLGVDDGDIINDFMMIIDFEEDQVRLPYNIQITNSWTKDFTETKYLGGAVRGDWNAAVSRSINASTKVVIERNPETIEAVRRLAEYPGICHIRTPEGSSFAANIDVSEDQEEKWINRLAGISLTITRIDSQGFDGLAYSEWHVEEQQEG